MDAPLLGLTLTAFTYTCTVSLFLILYFGGTVTTASTIVWVILITLDCLDHFIPTIFGVKKWFQTITIPMNAGILVERVGLFVIMR